MLKYILITFLISTALFAEDISDQKINEWYQKIFSDGGVSKQVFNTAIRGYFYYRKQGAIPNKNMMIIVNYDTPSSQPRFYLFQFGNNPKMLLGGRPDYVAHGKNSGPGGGKVNSFSNINGSLQSSKGFLRTMGHMYGPTYKTKKGIRTINHRWNLGLKGLEKGFNDQVGPRAVIMHESSYIGNGMGGRSWGCLATPTKSTKNIIEQIQNGVLIYSYGSASNSSPHKGYAFANQNISEEDFSSVASTENNNRSPEDPNIKGIESVERLSSAAPPKGEYFITDASSTYSNLSQYEDDDEEENQNSSQYSNSGKSTSSSSNGNLGALALIGTGAYLGFNSDDEESANENELPTPQTFEPNNEMSSGEVVPSSTGISGSQSFVNCQHRASVDWGIVVAEACKDNGDVDQYFRGTYKKLDDSASGQDMADSDVKHYMAIENLAENDKCVALARSMCHCQEFNTNQPNKQETVSTEDGSITCKKDSSESQDICACRKMVDNYNQSLEDEKQLVSKQESSFKAQGEMALQDLKNAGSSASIQASAQKAQSGLINSQTNISQQRKDFQLGRMQQLNKDQAALPNREKILSNCRQYMSKRRRTGVEDFNAYTTFLGSPPNQFISLPDPCLAVSKMMKVNLVQNIEARKQAVQAMEKAKYKAMDLNDKKSTLIDQSNQNKKFSLKGNGNPPGALPTFADINTNVSTNKGLKIVDFSDKNMEDDSSTGSNIGYAGGATTSANSKIKISKEDHSLVRSKNEEYKNLVLNFESEKYENEFKKDINSLTSLQTALLLTHNPSMKDELDYELKMGTLSKKKYDEILYYYSDLKQAQAEVAKDSGTKSDGENTILEFKKAKIHEKSGPGLFDIISKRYNSIFK